MAKNKIADAETTLWRTPPNYESDKPSATLRDKHREAVAEVKVLVKVMAKVMAKVKEVAMSKAAEKVKVKLQRHYATELTKKRPNRHVFTTTDECWPIKNDSFDLPYSP